MPQVKPMVEMSAFPWPVINLESVALVTRLRLFVVFFVVSQRQKKGAEEFEYQSGPCAGLAWKATLKVFFAAWFA